jgi:Rieske Fe-S protein
VIRQALVSVAASEVPADGALLFNRERVAVVRTEQGYHAMSLVCTHLGCTVTAAENTFACPCHGSRFDRQGRVLSGPATVALRRLKLEEQQGVLKVYEA